MGSQGSEEVCEGIIVGRGRHRAAEAWLSMIINAGVEQKKSQILCRSHVLGMFTEERRGLGAMGRQVGRQVSKAASRTLAASSSSVAFARHSVLVEAEEQETVVGISRALNSGEGTNSAKHAGAAL